MVDLGVQIHKQQFIKIWTVNMNSKYKEYNLSNLMTVKELQEYLKIGKNKAYSLVNKNEVPTVIIGNRTYVVVDKLQKYINTHTIF